MSSDHLAAYDDINPSNLHLIDFNLSPNEQILKLSDHLAAYDDINPSNLHLIDLNLSLDEQIHKLSVKQLSCPDWLPKNWKIDLKIRASGKSAGNADKYYVDPSGCRFRSKNEVMHFLQTGKKRKAGSEAAGSSRKGKEKKPAN